MSPVPISEGLGLQIVADASLKKPRRSAAIQRHHHHHPHALAVQRFDALPTTSTADNECIVGLAGFIWGFIWGLFDREQGQQISIPAACAHHAQLFISPQYARGETNQKNIVGCNKLSFQNYRNQESGKKLSWRTTTQATTTDHDQQRSDEGIRA